MRLRTFVSAAAEVLSGWGFVGLLCCRFAMRLSFCFQCFVICTSVLVVLGICLTTLAFQLACMFSFQLACGLCSQRRLQSASEYIIVMYERTLLTLSLYTHAHTDRIKHDHMHVHPHFTTLADNQNQPTMVMHARAHIQIRTYLRILHDHVMIY